MKKSVKYISIILLLIAVAAIIILPKILSTKDKQSGPQSTSDAKNQPVPANGFIVKTENLGNNIKTIGSIVANEEVELRSEISKKITGIYFKEGSQVSKGSTLFKLDDSELLAQLEKLQIEKMLIEKNLNRQKQLLDKNLSTTEEYDIALNSLDKVNADINIVSIQLDKTSINAPFSGIIGFRNASIGSYVSPNVILAVIQDISKVKVDFSIPEKYIQQFRIGDEISFKVDGMEEEFTGNVIAYEPKLDGNTRSLILRAVCRNPMKRLLPGTFANVSFNLNEISDAMLIPTNALIPKLKGQDVYVLKNGTAKLTEVQTGIRTEESIQITAGLNEGDTVLTTNVLRLRQDAKVVIDKIE